MSATTSDTMRHQCDALLAETISDAHGPGAALLVAQGGRVLYRGARGMASIEHSVPLTPDSLFRIGSITKTFTAAAVMQLCEAGALSLEDPLAKFLPDFPNAGAIIIRMLLDHTSGIQAVNLVPGWAGNPCRADVTMAESVASFKDLPVNFAPGTRYLYNNSGYLLLGAVLEAVTGQPWHQSLAALVAPLGLTRTIFGDNLRVIPKLADGYSTSKEGVITRAPFVSMTQPHAAGALVSGLDDLLNWAEALFSGGKVVQEATLQRMRTVVPPSTNYGLGLMTFTVRDRLAVGHTGSIHGFSSIMLYFPESQLTVVALQNSDADDVEYLARSAAALALGDPYPQEPAQGDDPSAASLAVFAGLFEFEDTPAAVAGASGTVQFEAVAGGLCAAGKLFRPAGPAALGVFRAPKSLIRVEFDVADTSLSAPISSLRVFLTGDGKGAKMNRVK